MIIDNATIVNGKFTRNYEFSAPSAALAAMRIIGKNYLLEQGIDEQHIEERNTVQYQCKYH